MTSRVSQRLTMLKSDFDVVIIHGGHGDTHPMLVECCIATTQELFLSLILHRLHKDGVACHSAGAHRVQVAVDISMLYTQ
jgi:hypothetical protein